MPYLAAHSKAYNDILKKYQKGDVPLPYPVWRIDEEKCWQEQSYIKEDMRQVKIIEQCLALLQKIKNTRTQWLSFFVLPIIIICSIRTINGYCASLVKFVNFLRKPLKNFTNFKPMTVLLRKDSEVASKKGVIENDSNNTNNFMYNYYLGTSTFLMFWTLKYVQAEMLKAVGIIIYGLCFVITVVNLVIEAIKASF